jgi:hypothetical protein
VSVLTSRQPDEIGSLFKQAGITIKIIEDRSVDPPMLHVKREGVVEKTLLLKKLEGLDVNDLLRLMISLDVPLDYEELK